MRIVLAVVLLAGSSLAQADRLIRMPTALKVRYNQARIEHQWDARSSKDSYTAIGAGITRDFEAEFFLESDANRRLGTLNLAYQYIVPIVDASPGIAVGVQDAMDQTKARRMFYLALTQRFGQSGEFNSNVPVEFTIGFGFGKRSGMYAGASLPFTWQFRLLAEYDFHQPYVGFEYRTHQGFALRTIYDEARWQLGARYTFKY